MILYIFNIYYLQLTEETYTITNLSPETDYEVRVCLANGTENDCGNCLKCFRTATAEGNNMYICMYMYMYLHEPTCTCTCTYMYIHVLLCENQVNKFMAYRVGHIYNYF